MRKKIVIPAALLLLLLFSPLAMAEDEGGGDAPADGGPSDGDTPGEDDGPDTDDGGSVSGGGCSCNCPTAEEIAEAVIAKLDEKTNKSREEMENSTGVTVEDAESSGITEDYINETFGGDNIEIPQLGCDVSFANISEIKREKELAKRTGLDTPLSVAMGDNDLLNSLLGFIGIEPDVIPVKDAPKIIYCTIASISTLWEYPSSVYGCLHDVSEVRLAEDQPRRIREQAEIAEWEKEARLACNATMFISRELTSNKTDAFDFFGSWEDV